MTAKKMAVRRIRLSGHDQATISLDFEWLLAHGVEVGVDDAIVTYGEKSIRIEPLVDPPNIRPAPKEEE